ncbi:DMT family transporter [Acinetobacter sp. WZC-1]|uniref:DMT family transporter n=1 Tax=Acinetobacter sp. WZC-1 TaxID=3459034 RepID=UPI00403DE531
MTFRRKSSEYIFGIWISNLKDFTHCSSKNAFCYTLYYSAIDKIGASSAGVFVSLVPVFGVFFGWLLLKETISHSMILGGGVVILGVFICNQSRKIQQINQHNIKLKE